MQGTEGSVRVVAAGRGNVAVVVEMDGQTIELPALWLRERTRDPEAVDLRTEQRLFDPHRVDPEVGIASATFDERGMHVRFTDGHATTFDTEWLSREAVGVTGLPPVVAWDSSLAIPPFHAWDAVSNHDDALRAALHDFLSLGAIVVDGAPIDEDTVLVVAARFGRVRETNFGVLFDVRSVPDADDLAYTAVHLGPHTDNPYRDPVPGIQLLHCLVNETTGGDSTLVDSVAVIEQLAAEDPAGVELLATIPVEFWYRDDT
ncbi:MAG TPA: TauD/TfdA family dioxygenase, partial [Ilumatobacteraceae bacterium]|nr:TauD/TfdA family dioxygenase [Ilumatobacteraceae bacterium]